MHEVELNRMAFGVQSTGVQSAQYKVRISNLGFQNLRVEVHGERGASRQVLCPDGRICRFYGLIPEHQVHCLGFPTHRWTFRKPKPMLKRDFSMVVRPSHITTRSQKQLNDSNTNTRRS